MGKSKELRSLSVERGVVMVFRSPDNRVLIFSSDQENTKKTQELMIGYSGGIYRSVAGYELPGGAVEGGEDIVQAITREVKEEVGWRVDFNEGKKVKRVDMGVVEVLQNRMGRIVKFGVRVLTMKLSWQEIEEIEKLIQAKNKSLRLMDVDVNVNCGLRERDRMILQRIATKGK